MPPSAKSALFDEGDWYLGLGLGPSWIRPNDTQSVVKSTDGNAISNRWFFGRTLAYGLFGEVAYQNLGSAKLSNSDSISYKLATLSLGKSLAINDLPSLSATGRVMLSRLWTNSLTEIEQKSPIATGLAIGAQWQASDLYTWRLEWQKPTRDTQALLMSFLYTPQSSPQNTFEIEQDEATQNEIIHDKNDTPEAPPQLQESAEDTSGEKPDAEQPANEDSSASPPDTKVLFHIRYQASFDEDATKTLIAFAQWLAEDRTRMLRLVSYTETRGGKAANERLRQQRLAEAAEILGQNNAWQNQLELVSGGDTERFGQFPQGRDFNANRRLELYPISEKK